MRLSVATHNICHMGKDPINRDELFPDKTYKKGYDPEDVMLMQRTWTAVYSMLQVDLLGIQEYFPWFDLAHTIPTDDILFTPYGLTRYRGDHGVAAASRYPLTFAEEGTYDTGFGRQWQKFYLEKDGIRLAVFNSHPTPYGTPEGFAARQAEYEALVRAFEKEEYFVSFGDYNARTFSEYGPFIRAGYPMAQTGFETVEGGSTTDNIITSKNIHIENVQVCDPAYALSDHAILRAELVVGE